MKSLARLLVFSTFCIFQISCSGASDSNESNTPPIVAAGGDIEGVEGEEYTITPDITDSDGVIDSVQWSNVSGIQISYTEGDNYSITLTLPSLTDSSSKTSILRVTAIDDDGSSASDEITVTTNPKPTPPSSDAGTDLIVVSGDSVYLNGTESSDNFDDSLEFEWSLLSPADTQLDLDSKFTAVANFIAPEVSETTLLEFSLEVSNNQQLSAADSVIVTVLPSNRRVLNDTGYTLCANYKSQYLLHWNDKLNCDESEDSNGWNIPEGQDGHLGLDTENEDPQDGLAGFSFTKLDSEGRPLPWDSEVWNCVRDNNTGLVWESGDTVNSNLYTWYEPSSAINGGDSGSQGDSTSCDGLDQCNSHTHKELINSEGLCGISDWQVPTNQELSTLVDYSESGNLDFYTNFFPSISDGSYWSRTTLAHNSGFVRSVLFKYGSISYPADKSTKQPLILVYNKFNDAHYTGVAPYAGGQECNSNAQSSNYDGRYQVTSSGTVIDRQTNLEWATDFDDIFGHTWVDALNTANNSDYAGKADWRVPNIKELYSLIETACSQPALNLSVFSNLRNEIYWSSTPTGADYETTETGSVRTVDFNYGTAGSSIRTATKYGDSSILLLMVRTADSE